MSSSTDTISPNSPLVTVVIPSYNCAEYITDAVVSVFSQTWKNIELVIIEDGSSDESIQVIHELQETYNLQLVVQENHGLPHALNRALDIARGKYFAVLACDDMMNNMRIQKQVQYLEANPDVTVCTTHMMNMDRHGEIMKKSAASESYSYTFDGMFWKGSGRPDAPTVMLRTEILKKVGGYREGLILEDLHIWLKLTSQGYRIVEIPDALTLRRKHDGNISSKHRLMLKDIIATLDEYSQHPRYPLALEQAKISMAVRCAQKDPEFARQMLGDVSLLHFPSRYLKALWRIYRSR